MSQNLSQLKINLTWVKKFDSSDSNSQPYLGIGRKPTATVGRSQMRSSNESRKRRWRAGCMSPRRRDGLTYHSEEKRETVCNVHSNLVNCSTRLHACYFLSSSIHPVQQPLKPIATTGTEWNRKWSSANLTFRHLSWCMLMHSRGASYLATLLE